MIPCEIKLSPDCGRDAQVRLSVIGFSATTCIECEKAFQKKFPHKVTSLSILPLDEKVEKAA